MGKRQVVVLNNWDTTCEDVRVNALLFENDKLIGNVIDSIPVDDIESFSNIELGKNVMKNFDKLKSLPKISKCGKLLQYLYTESCCSESGMVFIEYGDCDELKFTDNDVKELEKEIERYSLEDVIVLGGECAITCYSDLETDFNDDRDLDKTEDYFRESGEICYV